MQVELEDDAVPIVKILGALVRRSLAVDSIASHASRARGKVAFCSATNPQAATLRFDRKSVFITRGADSDADMVITANLDDSEQKPKVAGAARHPVLALAAAKVLEPPVGTWTEEADRFLSAALTDPECPRPIRIVATDVNGESKQWGGDGQPVIEIHGPEGQLAVALSGTSVLPEDILNAKLQMVGDLRDFAVLARFSISHMFGELT
jgi:hypothetical protein